MSTSDRLAALMHEPSTDAADDASRLRRVELSRGEMLAQGAAIAATLRGEQGRIAALADHLAGRRIRRVVIAGCGDSWGVGIAAACAFESLLKVPAAGVQAFDFAHYQSGTADGETLVIGLSASGKTEAVLAALEQAQGRGAVAVGVSNAPDSPLATRFAAGLTVHATRRGWPTQSSNAAIALLCALAAGIAVRTGSADAEHLAAFDRDLGSVHDLVDRITAAFDAPMAEVAGSLAAARILLFAGAGPHYAAAFFGAAKIKELGPIHAMAMPLEEYHHYRSQKAGDPLFLLAPDAASHERALDTALVGQARGGRTFALVPAGEQAIGAHVERAFELPPVRPELAAICYGVPLHLFAYHFAKARFERGLGYPGAFP